MKLIPNREAVKRILLIGGFDSSQDYRGEFSVARQAAISLLSIGYSSIGGKARR
jgi:hypothetical protein